MKRVYLILMVLLMQAAAFPQDSLKKTFVFIQAGGLKQINIDNNGRNYYGCWAGAHAGFKTRKHLLVQTGLEYYRVYFYAKYMNSGPGTSDNDNAFRFNKFCIPVYFNYISAKNNVIIGAGPVIDLVRNYTRSYIREQADPNTQTWSQQPMSETITDFSPLYLSAAAKSTTGSAWAYALAF